MKFSDFQDVAHLAVSAMTTRHDSTPGWSPRASMGVLCFLWNESQGQLSCLLRESIFEAKKLPEAEVGAHLGQMLYIAAAAACVLQLDLNEVAKAKAVEIEKAFKGRRKSVKILKTRMKPRTGAKKGAGKA